VKNDVSLRVCVCVLADVFCQVGENCPITSSLLRPLFIINHQYMLNSVKHFSCIYGNDHMILLHLVNVVNYTDLLSCII